MVSRAEGGARTRGALGDLAPLLRAEGSIGLVGHSPPDGDSLMAVLALRAALRHWGVEAAVLLYGQVSYNYDHYWEPQGILSQPPETPLDTVVALDCANLSRLGAMAGVFQAARLRIVIDHHVTNTGFGNFNLVDTTVSSTCELIHGFMAVNAIPIDPRTAERLYVGILTDTGKFQYPITTGDTHRVIGDLIDRGARPAEIFKNVFRDKPPGLARIWGQALAGHELHVSGRVAMAGITAEMAAANEVRIDEVDGVIDELMAIRGVNVACVLKEHRPDYTKVSLRSESGYPLTALASMFQGGGHAHAAGFGLAVSLKEARDLMVQWLTRVCREHDAASGGALTVARGPDLDQTG